MKEGWKLEAVSPLDPTHIYPATVTRVLDEQFFIVQLDDVSASPSRTEICCHRASLGIFPINWCLVNGLRITPPKGLYIIMKYVGLRRQLGLFQ